MGILYALSITGEAIEEHRLKQTVQNIKESWMS